ncbi:biotin synthase BioB [Clostridium botulinum]|uniref:biotin synthase BioB n=1 Tax=Clostridium botulinum TaxID=1491 RepID=UPI00052DF09D|nr:biotin synthase BioB [Clostridium botulinum]KGM97600.1 biotin synthase [Clostridium botulinum D str. CCUG 7971]KOC51002.1 biotin synthase [Clostridium botulinum]NFO96892.1 biotin synthase BioB [Clostridium botulinum]OOV52757.1 biotin synthase BioB [Clostridium botulinum D/C]OOV57364.1 biotin synthase BioB [Clostridium botulinum D/C]
MINKLVKKIINKEYDVSYDEAINLINADINELLNGANKLRETFCGNHVELCSIIDAKCGKCSEDCKFCAQSAHHNTQIVPHSLYSYDKMLKLAKENESEGVHRYSLVTSGRGMSGEEFKNVLNIYKKLKKDTNIKLCASFGIINKEQLQHLKKEGVMRYHHNLESSREFYSKICTTHSYDERIATIKNAQDVGLEVCSGGIIGMGETFEDRINLAIELKKLKIMSIPINVLMPIKGTPLENQKPLDNEEILRTIAIFRFLNPKADIRLAGGRNKLENYGEKAFISGASATITGNYLTTSGNGIKNDIELLKSLGLKVN